MAVADTLEAPRNRHRSKTRTTRVVVREILRAGADDFAGALDSLRLEPSAHAVHHARITIRRVQSALGLGSKVFAAGSTDTVRRELGWIMAALGEIRDLDVLIPRLHGLHADDQLITAFAADRSDHAMQLHIILESARCTRLVEMLRTAAQSPTTVPQADDAANRRLRPIVRRRWHKLADAVADLPPQPSPEQLHHVRIVAKRCRYTSELCAGEFGVPARTMARRLRKLQDELGALHDTGVFIDRMRDIGIRRPSLAFFAGEAAGAAATLDHADPNRWRRAWNRVDRREVLRWL